MKKLFILFALFSLLAISARAQFHKMKNPIASEPTIEEEKLRNDHYPLLRQKDNLLNDTWPKGQFNLTPSLTSGQSLFQLKSTHPAVKTFQMFTPTLGIPVFLPQPDIYMLEEKFQRTPFYQIDTRSLH